MPNPAEVTDVEARWRPLTAQESPVVETWLEDAWRRLKSQAPGLQDRLTAETTEEEDVVAVLAEAVIRKAKNADGHRQGSITVDDATRSWTIDSQRSGGNLYFTRDELLQVGASSSRGRAYSVQPT